MRYPIGRSLREAIDHGTHVGYAHDHAVHTERDEPEERERLD